MVKIDGSEQFDFLSILAGRGQLAIGPPSSSKLPGGKGSRSASLVLTRGPNFRPEAHADPRVAKYEGSHQAHSGDQQIKCGELQNTRSSRIADRLSSESVRHLRSGSAG
jgi:hypothetical protein